jgi:hypothetical protein
MLEMSILKSFQRSENSWLMLIILVCFLFSENKRLNKFKK